MMHVTPEVHFAQHLAANDKRIRDKALKKLRKWLEAKSSSSRESFAEEDMLKIWKGLFYCMWMCDKPLIQEDLATRISNLIHCFSSPELSFMFVDAFYKTISREWFFIDKYRIEKMMMFVRRVLRESFEYLHRRKWKPGFIKKLMYTMKQTVMHPTNEEVPLGLKLHVADIILSELARCGGYELTPKRAMLFLYPFFRILAQGTEDRLLFGVKDSIFKFLMEFDEGMQNGKNVEPTQENEDDEDEEGPVLDQNTFVEAEQDLIAVQFDYSLIADKFLQIAKKADLKPKNRKIISLLVRKFWDLSRGINPLKAHYEDEVSDTESDISQSEIEAAARRLAEEEYEYTKEKRQQRKNTPSIDEDDNCVDDDDEEEGDEDNEEMEIVDTEISEISDYSSPKKKSQRKMKAMKRKQKPGEDESGKKEKEGSGEEGSETTVTKTSDNKKVSSSDGKSQKKLKAVKKRQQKEKNQISDVTENGEEKDDEFSETQSASVSAVSEEGEETPVRNKSQKKQKSVKRRQNMVENQELVVGKKKKLSSSKIVFEESLLHTSELEEGKEGNMSLQLNSPFSTIKRSTPTPKVRRLSQKRSKPAGQNWVITQLNGSTSSPKNDSILVEKGRTFETSVLNNGQSQGNVARRLSANSVEVVELPSSWEVKVDNKADVSKSSDVSVKGVNVSLRTTPAISRSVQTSTKKDNEFIKFDKISPPAATFFKKCLSKFEVKKPTPKMTITPVKDSSAKKVKFALTKNQAQDPKEYQEQVKSSPSIPFDVNKLPAQGVLKQVSKKSENSASSPALPRRSVASDFF